MRSATLGCCRWSKRHRYDWIPSLSRALLKHQYRVFSTIQSGHDVQKESLFNKMGYKGDKETQCFQRPLRDLDASFVLQAEKLLDPVHNLKDRARLEEFKEAYLLLRDDNFRRNYASHHCSSNDARLHVLQDGGEVAVNFNPEHRDFDYIDHSVRGWVNVDRPADGGSLGIDGGDAAPVVRSFGDFQDAFRDATGMGESTPRSADVRAHRAADARAPARGADLPFLLRITFEEGLLGCSKVIEYPKDLRCARCDGQGRATPAKPRACAQCLGRGHVRLPSATYHLERVCGGCRGAGTATPPRCPACHGRGVRPRRLVRLPVRVPPGTTTHAVRRLAQKGHDGPYGGPSGDVVLTIMVAEHRFFERRGEDLHAMLPVPLSTALLGGVVTVATLDGPTPLRVPPCVGNGQVLSLSRFGLPCPRGGSEGALAGPHEGGNKSGNRYGAGGHNGPSPVNGSDSNRRTGDVFYHVLVLIPDGGRLTGRQKEALGLYDDATQVCLNQETKMSMDFKSGAHSSEGSEERMQQCAALKVKYRHWFTA